MNRRQLLSAIPAVGVLSLMRSNPAAAVGSGTYEDTDVAVVFSGAGWATWSDPANSGGSVRYSSIAGAAASLAFSGSSIAVVFLKQWNGGIATVTIDGIVVDSLDTYSATRQFQQSKTYQLAAGAHTIGVAISGNANPGASGTYLLFDAFIVAGAVPPPPAGKRIQTIIDLVGQNPAAGLAFAGNQSVTYGFGGNALSASTRLMWFDQGLAPIVFARWLVVWNPRNAMTGLRLLNFDAGPANIVEMGRIENSSAVTPITSGADVTLQMKGLGSAGLAKFLGQQEKGNGGEGPLIFSSALEIVWDLS